MTNDTDLPDDPAELELLLEKQLSQILAQYPPEMREHAERTFRHANTRMWRSSRDERFTADVAEFYRIRRKRSRLARQAKVDALIRRAP
ncbi:MAG: hypothetical protein JWO05_1042 [Gemmatimonadetes bacterium]|nr:hypothetical protein [Gemmatimonadota bacterium]